MFKNFLTGKLNEVYSDIININDISRKKVTKQATNNFRNIYQVTTEKRRAKVKKNQVSFIF